MARGADTLGLEIHYAMQMSCVTQSPLYAVPPYARRIPWKSGTGRKKKTGQRDRSTIQSKYALMPCSPCWSFFVFFSLVPLSRTYMCSIVLPLSQPPPPFPSPFLRQTHPDVAPTSGLYKMQTKERRTARRPGNEISFFFSYSEALCPRDVCVRDTKGRKTNRKEEGSKVLG